MSPSLDSLTLARYSLQTNKVRYVDHVIEKRQKEDVEQKRQQTRNPKPPTRAKLSELVVVLTRAILLARALLVCLSRTLTEPARSDACTTSTELEHHPRSWLALLALRRRGGRPRSRGGRRVPSSVAGRSSG